jgi:cholesterol transport system auxiliary component
MAPRPPNVRLAAALLACVGALACITVSGGEPNQTVQTFIFEPTLPRPARAGGGSGVLLVSPPDSAPGYGTRFMLYSHGPSELSWYAYSQWADGPARMLETLLVRSLDLSGHFDAVVDISAGVLSDLRLDTEIVTLRQEIATQTASQVRLEVRAGLIDLRARAVLANRTFEITRPAASNDARGGVAAINEALTDLLVQMSDWAGEASRARGGQR